MKILLLILIFLSVVSCSSQKKAIDVGYSHLSEKKSNKINIDYDSVLSSGKDVDVSKFSLNEIFDLIKYSYNKSYYGTCEKLIKKNLNVLKSDKDEYLKVLFIYSQLLKNNNKYDLSDTAYLELFSYIRHNFNDSIHYLGEAYTGYGDLNIAKQHYRSAYKLLNRALYYNQFNDTNFNFLIKDYKILNNLFYYRGLSTKSTKYFYKALKLQIRFDKIDDALNLVYNNVNYLKSRSMPLDGLKHSLSMFPLNKCSDSQIAYFLILKAKIYDDIMIDSKDTVVYIYNKLDSMYKKDKCIFENIYTLYFETYFPILNRLKMINEANLLFNKITEDFGASKDSLINQQTVNLAYWAYNLGDYAKSQKLFKQALSDYRKKYGDESPLVAELMDKIGVMYLSSGLTFEAKNFFNKSYEIKKKYIKNDKFEMGITCLNLGEVSRQEQDYDNAKKNFYRAIENWSNIKDSSFLYRSRAYHSLGVVYTDTKDYDSSFVYLDLALHYKRLNFGSNSPLLIYTNIAIAKLYEQIGNIDSSKIWYKRSKNLININGLNNSVYDLSYKIGYGILNLRSHKFDKAKKYFNLALDFLNKNKESNSEKIRQINKYLLRIAQESNNSDDVRILSKQLFGDIEN